MTARDDIGPAVVEYLFDTLRIDDAWSDREPRGFGWWAHRLPQRVWAEPARASHDHEVVRVHATTAVLRNVRGSADLPERLATTNRLMSLGALVWSPQSERVVLHAAAQFHAENVPWLQTLFLAAVGLQVADAHVKADALAGLLGGEPDVSAHPRSGRRSEPDDILRVIADVFAPAGADASPWTDADFAATVAMTPRPWVLATPGTTGLTAEFAFSGELPAPLAAGLQTALFTASAGDRHPQLGNGLLLRLQLPFNLTEEKGAELAWMLNGLEMTEQTDTHCLGAWCLALTPPERADAHTLTFVSFVPAAAYRKGLLDVLALDMAIRTRWTARTLGAAGRTNTRSAATTPAPSKQRTVAEVHCWSCKAPLAVTPETRGKNVKCPRCGTKQPLPR
jgi:hypothetical protein